VSCGIKNKFNKSILIFLLNYLMIAEGDQERIINKWAEKK
jgi:hypothetical protein